MSIRLDYTADVQQEIDTWGDKPITSMIVRRAPVMAWIETFFGFITAGQWDKVKQKYGYDKFYHLSLIVTYATAPTQTDTVTMNFLVDDMMPQRSEGIKVVVEKLALVNVSRRLDTKPNSEFHTVDMRGRVVTLGQMLERTRRLMGDQAFFTYDAFSNNCQVFVKSLLESEHLLSREGYEFLFQPVDKLLKELPSYTSKVARFVTNLGGIMTGVINGYKPSGTYVRA
jgi:hypothetical protein